MTGLVLRDFGLRDFDTCYCGDYRHQHENGKGRCLLGSRCTPRPCQKFRLSQKAIEIPAIYRELRQK